jgi:lipoprotein NlpI
MQMRWSAYWLFACLAVVALAGLLTVAAADDADTCAKQSGDVAIAACSRAIASGKFSGEELAAFYVSRGFEYKNKRGLDRAIADFDQAVRLDPKNSDVYTVRGMAWEAKGDFERAIADFDQAIRLDPKNTEAYTVRAMAWQTKGDLDRAIADYDQAIRIDPKNTRAYSVRGVAWAAKGDLDRAIADYDQAIRLDPKNSSWYFHRGLSNLYAGALPTALADLNQASELNPKHAYVALWLDIVNKRSNLPSRLAEAAKQINMTWWPAPVIRLYLGQLTSEAALAAADVANPRAKQGRVCELNFYTGELALQQGNADEAKRLFSLAAADCPKDFDAYAGATAELKVLGARP